MPRVDYASQQPCCSLWLFVQLELYSALSLDYAVVVAMSFSVCVMQYNDNYFRSVAQCSLIIHTVPGLTTHTTVKKL